MSDDPLVGAGINPDDEDLPAIARAVATSIEGLSVDVRELTRRVRQNRIVTIGLCLILAAVAVLGVLVTAQQRQINETRREVLCPLYSLLTDSYSPAGRERYPRGPIAYDEAFIQLREQRAVLDCRS